MNRITNLCCSLLQITLVHSLAVPTTQANTLPAEIVTFTYSLVSQQVSLNEPVILNFTVQNNSDRPINLDLGKDRKENFLFTITRPDGTIVSLPPRHAGGLGRLGIVSVEGGHQYSQKLLLNEWTDFGSVGKYDIELRLAKSVQVDDGIASGESTFSHANLTVRPRNPASLEEVCASLTKQVEDSSSYEEAAEAALTLSYIRDSIAVPYLNTVLHARRLVDSIAINGLEKIGNKEAVQAMISALAIDEPSQTASTARAALENIEEKTTDAAIKEAIRKAIASTKDKSP